MSSKISIVIEHDEDGYYAFCPELEGCQSEGETFDEVIANIREAVSLYMETMTPDERRGISTREIFTTSMEVNVA